VEHALARAIWHEYLCLEPLERIHRSSPDEFSTHRIAEMQRLRDSIAAKLQKLRVVEDYSLERFQRDKRRFDELYAKGRAGLSITQEREAIKLLILISKYPATPEALGRDRIATLERKQYYPHGKIPAANQEGTERQGEEWAELRSPEEHAELEALKARYPAPPAAPLTDQELRTMRAMAALRKHVREAFGPGPEAERAKIT
jgi:hypothetical protein